MTNFFHESAKVPELAGDLSVRLMEWAATSGVRILLILILTVVAMTVSRRVISYLRDQFSGEDGGLDRTKRADTLTGVMRAVRTLVIGLAASMMILQEIGIDIAPILATAGLGGLAVGFGAQSLVKDVITGFFLLVEDQVRVGDVVEVAGRGGVVERIGLRTIVLRDATGAVHTIPNGAVDVIKNMTRDYSRYVFDVGVAYREDTDEVARVLVEIMEELRKDQTHGPNILEPLEVLGVNSFEDSAVILRARIMTRAGAQWGVGREFNRRMKKRFDELGIEIPFPQITIWAGEPKIGDAPALRLAVKDGK